MRLNNLYVVDEKKQVSLTRKGKNATVVVSNIYQRVDTEDGAYLLDLEKNAKYYETTTKSDFDIVLPGIPLSDYYYSNGIKKKNEHDNQEKVYAKVKELKEKGIL